MEKTGRQQAILAQWEKVYALQRELRTIDLKMAGLLKAPRPDTPALVGCTQHRARLVTALLAARTRLDQLFGNTRQRRGKAPGQER